MSARISTVICMLLLGAAAFGLYLVKYEVQGIQDELKATLAQLEEEREGIRVLKAEWQYLNRPERLEELAEKHLGLAPATAMQIGEIVALPMIADAPPAATGIIPASATEVRDER